MSEYTLSQSGTVSFDRPGRPQTVKEAKRALKEARERKVAAKKYRREQERRRADKANRELREQAIGLAVAARAVDPVVTALEIEAYLRTGK